MKKVTIAMYTPFRAQPACTLRSKHTFCCPCLYSCGNWRQDRWLTSWSRIPNAMTGNATKKMLNADMSQSLYTTCPEAAAWRLYMKRVRPKARFL